MERQPDEQVHDIIRPVSRRAYKIVKLESTFTDRALDFSLKKKENFLSSTAYQEEKIKIKNTKADTHWPERL